jgi:hypothetical protein
MNKVVSAALVLILLAATFFTYSQTPTQRISGMVLERASRQPLIGASVFIRLDDADSTLIGTVTDIDGQFRLENIPVGRHYLHCSYMGYEPYTSAYLELTSAKQLVIEIELNEMVTLAGEVVVYGRQDPGAATNDFSMLSARSFTPEETQRFAGSINDPGRMALSLPGAQISSQDNENTIVVRANSPIGLSWQLEGVEIPNPNHFADPGSSGGGISALSIYVLGGSDFFTGAFPPEFGNALAGVMDLKFRKGNQENREFRIQAGLIGLDFASEGPISKKKKTSSYLFNYRYSTLGILSSLGINVVNPLTSNTFQDLSFNLNFPVSKKAHITFFGFGGSSAEHKKPESDLSKWESYNEAYSYDLNTRVGTTGLTFTYLINSNSFLNGVLSVGANEINRTDDTVSQTFIKTRIRNETSLNGKLTTAWYYNRKFGTSTNFKAGFKLSRLFYDVFREDFDNVIDELRPQLDGSGQPTLFQPYAVVRTQISPVLTLQGGLNGMYFTYTGEFLAEPRAGVQLQFSGVTINAAYGMHSQVLPFQTYENVTTDSLTGAVFGKPNTDLKMWRAHHVALAISKGFPGNIRLKIEPYYQYLFDVPVSTDPWNTYSLINQDHNYQADTLTNAGTGYNTGIELTVEKTFSNKLFFLLTGSVYESKYKTNNGGIDQFYNTKYNSTFNSALTLGKEWDLKNGKRFELGGRILWAGGMRYSPFDLNRSLETGRGIPVYDQAYLLQNKNYFRTDLRIALRKNAPRLSWKLSLDIQNLTDYDNPQRPYYDRWSGTQEYGYNTSIIPVISYTIDF